MVTVGKEKWTDSPALIFDNGLKIFSLLCGVYFACKPSAAYSVVAFQAGMKH